MHRGQGVRIGRLALVLMAGASLTACGTITPKYSVRGGTAAAPAPYARAPSGPKLKGTDQPYQVGGIWYLPHEQPNYNETGIASWYGDAFNMKATADGEIFDMSQISAAHTTLPLPSMVEVTNLDNGKKLVVRVNDRGPFVGGRIIDLSHAAAQELGYDRAGTAHVRVRYVGPAPLAGPDAGVRYAKASPAPAYAATRAPAAPLGLTLASSRRPADEEIFAGAAMTPVAAAAATPLVRAPEVVSMSVLSPLAPVRNSRSAPIPEAPVPPLPSSSSTYRIQAGAFSDQDNARRAAAQLSTAGTATIEPMERGGTTLYRVILPGPADEAEAFTMRDKVAAIGFADARVLRP